MERFSKWRDPATGIQPFLPPQPPSSSPLLTLLAPIRFANAVLGCALLAILALVHILLDGVALIFTPLPPVHRAVSGLFTSLTCRLALGVMRFYWIRTEMTSPKRGSSGSIAQTIRSPQRGDLILSNWTSYVDVLYLAFRHNPVFLLPVFAPSEEDGTGPLTGRHTGTGSANISLSLTQPKLLGYQPIPLLALLARTGTLPPTYITPPTNMYKTLREARRKEYRPVCLLPEGTTSNGRAVLRLPDGVLAKESESEADGIIWVTFIRHSAPTPQVPTSTCSLPSPLTHLFFSLLYTHSLVTRDLTVRTLHPTNSPSSPSFLPSEILANAPGGLEGVADSARWKEAIASVMAETGRARRVRGMGWVEKGAFLEYYAKGRR